MTTDGLVERYLVLGLRLGRHVEDFVDAYFGPSALEDEVAAEPVQPPGALADDGERLLADVQADGAIDPGRGRWLEAQLTAIATAARKLAGEEISYADEVERCYGVRPSRHPESDFAHAHEQLEQALPGSETLAERWAAYLERAAVPGQTVAHIAPGLADELRGRTAAAFGLPPGEAVEFHIASGKPWTAFNYYLGDLRSRIEINTDLPIPAEFVVEVVAHEAYPGHHTERAFKEAVLVHERGYGEHAVLMTPAPESVISEGIATIATEVLLGDEVHELAAEHLRRAGFAYDAQAGAAVAAARETLGAVGANAAWLLHEEGMPLDEVRAYVERWSLHPPERVEATLRFITDPAWGSYVSCYREGRRLARGFVNGDAARFKRLLTEPLIPADLAA